MVGVSEVFSRVYGAAVHGSGGGGDAGAAVAGMLASFFFLAQAAKALPIGTAYVVWTGIGAAGAFLAGVVLFREPVTPARCFFAALLLTGIVGLKLTSGE